LNNLPSTDRSSLSSEFLKTVLDSKPRIAVFDCDGTLWPNNSGEQFFYWSMEHGVVSADMMAKMKQRYEDYREGNVSEEDMCGEMTTMYAGVTVAGMEKAAVKFFHEYVRPHYFAEMRELTNSLAKQGCELWAVSSTNEWVIREGIRDFGIPAQNVLAGTAECTAGTVREKLTRMPSGEGKAVAIRDVIARPVDAVFGNSIHDLAMLRLAKQPYAVNPNFDLEIIAKKNNWSVYWPEATRAAVGS
jgi:phosphoserine phosphatase